MNEDLIVVLGLTCPCRAVSADDVAQNVDHLGSAPNGIMTEREFLNHEFMCKFCGGTCDVSWREPTDADFAKP